MTTRKCYRRCGTNFPQSLELHKQQIQIIKPTDVLIQIHAIALNYRDVNILNGTNPWDVKPGGIPCSDAAGEVIKVGSKVTRFQVGDRVCPIFDQISITGDEQSREWLGGEVDGVLATHCVFHEEKIVTFPEHLSWAEASCLPCAGLTAWSALTTGGSLMAGKTVLIQGTGGVSLMALKLSRADGCKVILTSSSNAKLEQVQKIPGIGRISTINYSSNPRWDEEVIRINGGVGADIVVENRGTSSLMRSLNAVAKRGTVSQVGYLGKQNPKDLEGFLSRLIDKTANLRGINVGSRHDFEQLNHFISMHELRFEELIDKRFHFEDAADAFECLWSGKHVGKIVIELP